MTQTICDNVDCSNSVATNISERKCQLNDKLLSEEDSTLNDNMQLENNSCVSMNLQSSSNCSSDVTGGIACEQNLVYNAESSNVVSSEVGDEIRCINMSERTQSVYKFRTIIDSDSEDDTYTSATVNNSKTIVAHSQMNQLTEKSKSFLLHNDSKFDDDFNHDKVNKENFNDSNHSVENEPVIKKKSKRFNDLIDSESEDENDYKNEYSSNEDLDKHSSIVNKSQNKNENEKSMKKWTGTKRAAKDEAMRHIHSETQRLIREAPVSLPYHRPKQRSLQEFLNRKKVTAVIPKASTAAAKMRMSVAIVNEVVKAKEKEAKLFYKSSDSEDDEISVPVQSTDLRVSSLSSITPAHVSSEETEKLHKIDTQNAQDEKQIIQQNVLELGVSRKLFTDDNNDSLEVQTVDKSVIELQHDDDSERQQKEYKLDLKEVCKPRKLFNDNFNDSVGGSLKEYDSYTSDSIIQADNNGGRSQVDAKVMGFPDKIHAEILKSDENDPDNDEISQISVISTSKSNEKSQHSSQTWKDGKLNDSSVIQSTSLLRPSNRPSETCSIYNTPLISNKEIQKLSDKGAISEKSSSFSSEICIEDTSELSEPDCGVKGLPLPVFDDFEEEIKSPQMISMQARKKKLINVFKSKPMLRGIPGTLIDFTSDVKPNKAAVNSLVDRFISKHSVVSKHVESTSEVTVLRTETTTEGLKIYKDVLPYNLPAANEKFDDSDLNKPGAKLMRLKVELEKKMASKRNEEWKQREQEMMVDEEEEAEEVETGELEPEEKDEGLKKDEEIAYSEESEPEEDVSIRDKKRKSCAFVDEEAEEVDDDSEIELNADEVEEDDEDRESDEEEDDYGEKVGDEDNDEKERTQIKPKRFSRIVADNDDSNSGDAIHDEKVLKKFERERTDADIFDDDDDKSPVSQQILQSSLMTPIFKTPLTPSTPVNSLEFRGSQFNSLSTGSLPSDLNARFHDINSYSSDKQSQNNKVGMKNNLFEIQDRNVTDEELIELCSGKFTDSEIDTKNNDCRRLINLTDSVNDEMPITTSQIIDICSGTFSSQGLLSSTDLSGNVDETSQDIRLNFNDSSQSSDDHILEKKHEESKISSGVQLSSHSFLDIASSSSDEIDSGNNNHNKIKVLKKKKVKQLILSDDEDEDTVEKNCRIDEKQVEDITESYEDEETFIDYDSEENEVVITNQKDLKKVAADFVDAEAELSESEWGSEDEDEEGMEKMELEEGDDEEIDEDQMRTQLGKLHARQLLDDDQRDVRMLKEMLFEDGDLHTDGSRRERRFKWRNIDKFVNEPSSEPTNHTDDGNQLDPTELENEIEWRKLRLEREKFLEEKMKSETGLDTLADIDIGSGSKILEIGMKVLKKCRKNIEIKSSTMQTSKPIVPRTVSELINAFDGKTRILHNAMKRGSFLARGDEALARLAVMVKKSDTVDLAPKYSRNFLFTHISPSVTGEDEEDFDDDDDLENKRENIEQIQKPAKKRKVVSSGTPKTAKKLKINTSRPSGKKLF